MINRSVSIFALVATAFAVRAQELDIDIGSDGISINSRHWYENPLVWVGALVLVLIIVLLTRRSKA